MIESIFYLALGSIVIIESIYNAGVPIFFLIPYLIIFFGFQHYAYLRSNCLISFWKGSKPGCIYVKGGTHIHLVYAIGTTSRIIISILFIGSLFTPSRKGIIYVNKYNGRTCSSLPLICYCMISLGLLIGINRRILIRYNLINTGRENICKSKDMIFFFNPRIIYEKYSHDIGDLVLLSCFVILH